MKVAYYIPSRSRAGNVATLKSIPEDLLKHTYIVCSPGQRKEYVAAHPGIQVLEAGRSVVNLPTKRDWIIQRALKDGYTHCIQMDDDLRFYRRRTDDTTKFVPANIDSMSWMFVALWGLLQTHAHVGVTAKFGSNRVPPGTSYNTRAMRIHGYDLEVVKKTGLKFGILSDMEDFYGTLYLLTRGYSNAVLGDWAQDQSGSNTDGGCSEYRNMENHAATARLLADMFPGIVAVVQKETKGSWGGGVRTDVRIAWKKAAKQGAQR